MGCQARIVTYFVPLNSTPEARLLTLLNEAINLLWRLSAACPMLGLFLACIPSLPPPYVAAPIPDRAGGAIFKRKRSNQLHSLKAEYCQLCDKETADNVFRLQLNVSQGANHDSDAVYVVRDGSQGRRRGGDEGWKLQNNLA